MDEIKKLKESMKSHAEKEGIKLNPNENIVNVIFNGLLKNKEKKGSMFCPCRIPTGDEEEDKKIVCPCVYHLEEIKKDGHCKCNLFVKLNS